jgi:hypothetical protein
VLRTKFDRLKRVISQTLASASCRSSPSSCSACDDKVGLHREHSYLNALRLVVLIHDLEFHFVDTLNFFWIPVLVVSVGQLECDIGNIGWIVFFVVDCGSWASLRYCR